MSIFIMRAFACNIHDAKMPQNSNTCDRCQWLQRILSKPRVVCHARDACFLSRWHALGLPLTSGFLLEYLSEYLNEYSSSR